MCKKLEKFITEEVLLQLAPEGVTFQETYRRLARHYHLMKMEAPTIEPFRKWLKEKGWYKYYHAPKSKWGNFRPGKASEVKAYLRSESDLHHRWAKK